LSQQSYDYAVVGGGIAGLAIAEIFARSGRRVVLVERNKYLCQEASASHHGWFHFGSLYSIFPHNQYLRTMVGGVEDLLEYYAEFSGMNIVVTSDGQLVFPQHETAWFRDEPIEYIVSARNDPDFNMRNFDGVREYSRKLFFVLTWEMAIKQFISRHQRFHKHNWANGPSASQWIPRAGWADYSREVITKPDHTGINIDHDTHFRVTGYDRPMRSVNIITDLISNLFSTGGEVHTQTEVEHIEKTGAGARLTTTNGEVFEAQNVIICAGKWLGSLLGDSAAVRVVASPLLVAYPAVTDRNFVRMTPFVEKSVNHLHHQINNHIYSLIGGGYYADPNDSLSMADAREKLMAMAENVFPKLKDAKIVETYLGFKTEMVAKSGERNYQYLIREVDDNIYAVVPGKFSLAFSLAVNTFKRLTGEMPVKAVRAARSESVHTMVLPTKHASIIMNAL